LSGGTRNRPPLSPLEAWLSDGRQVLHFRPSRWDRLSQQLEVTVGELLPGSVGAAAQAAPRAQSGGGHQALGQQAQGGLGALQPSVVTKVSLKQIGRDPLAFLTSRIGWSIKASQLCSPPSFVIAALIS